MSLIELFLPTRRTDDSNIGLFDPLSNFWYQPVAGPTAARISVTDTTALTYSAVWAATRLLSGTGAWLPLNLYRRDPGKSPEDVDDVENILYDDPRNIQVERRPNPEMTGILAKAQAFQQQINSGNAYFEIERSRGGDALAQWPIHYSRVRAVRDDDTNELLYEVKNKMGVEPSYIPAADMLHFPSMMSDDGITGKGVIRFARESIAMGLATEKHGASYFGTGGIPRIIITQKGSMKPEARENFRKEWKEIYGGAEGDKIALLTEGASVTPIAISNDDSQFLQTRQFNIEEIARWYGVPPHMIQHLLNSNYSTVEQMAIEFVVYSLIPWLKIWEEELSAKLLTPEEQLTTFFRFNVTELLRGDSKTRSEYIRTLIQIGVLSPDEGRRMEGRNPVGGASAGYFMQGAMMPIEKLGEQPAPSVPGIPSTPDEQKGTDTQAAVVLRAVFEQGRRIEGRVGTAITAALNGMRDEFQKRIVAVPAESPDTRTPALVAAAKVMLVDAAGRIIRREVAAARLAAKTPGTFIAWLDKFYGDEYPKLCEKVFTPICSALIVLGIPASASQLAATGAAESRDALLTISGECSAKDLAGKVEALVAEWEKSGAQAIADSVIPKGEAA